MFDIGGTKMVEGLIYIITDSEEYLEFYDFLFFKSERVEIHYLRNAIDVLKTCHADIILLDCNIDVDAGLKLLKEIKVMCPHIPIIFLTGVVLENLVLNVFRGGARDFFRKPFNIPELQDTVEGLLTAKKISKERRAPFLRSIEH